MAGRSKTQRANFVTSYVQGNYVAEPLTAKRRVQMLVVSLPWLMVQLLAIVFDVITYVIQCDGNNTIRQEISWPVLFCTVNVSLVYVLDIVLRVYGFGIKVFTSKWWNILDSVVVLGTVAMIYEGYDSVGLLRLGRMARVVRIIRLLTVMIQASLACCSYMRRITGENKKRFISPTEDFDLDLAYITPRLIGMSVPSTGCMSFYRNPISEVARFFEKFHRNRYVIANVCPEIPYPIDAFKTGRFFPFNVQDHTPPLMGDFVKFIAFAKEWLSADDDNVLAVHCRGGKGRTGSFCCAWLLYCQDVDDTPDALNFYAMRRTDMEQVHTTKIQGVETPSQVRFLKHFEELLRRQNAHWPYTLEIPPADPCRLITLRSLDMFRREPPTQLVAVVTDVSSDAPLFSSHISDTSWDLGGTLARGDVRISVFDHSKMSLSDTSIARGEVSETANRKMTKKKFIAGQEPGCLFYCFLHTFFLEGSELVLRTPMIDKACKDLKLYNENGGIVLSFERQSST